jgi:hypothetical protein
VRKKEGTSVLDDYSVSLALRLTSTVINPAHLRRE